MSSPRPICVGIVVGSFGIRGQVKIRSFTHDPAALVQYNPLTTEDGRSFVFSFHCAKRDLLIGSLSGISTPEQARKIKQTLLYADRSVFPETDEDEFYYSDLIGMVVQTTQGRLLGNVEAVYNHGGGDVVQIVDSHNKEILLSFSRQIFSHIDLIHRRIDVDLPDEIEAEEHP